MALTTVLAGDYYLLADNVVLGVPKAAYTPVKGNLVIRDTTLDAAWDVCADGEAPGGIVVAVNSNATRMSVALLVPGTYLILPSAAALALGNKILASAGGMVDVGTMGIQRTQIKADAGGVGSVIDLGSGGAAATQTVAF